MTIEHNLITDPKIHEPKGVSSASAGEVYVADGLGSGSWTNKEPKNISTANTGQTYIANGSGSGSWTYSPQGWGYYEDNAASSISVGTSRTKLTINGNGSDSTSDYLPREIRGTGELWDTSGNKVTPMTLGDNYLLRVNFYITAISGAPTFIILESDISGVGSDIVTAQEVVVNKRTAPFLSTEAIEVFTTSTALTNGFTIYLTTDSGTVTIGDRSIVVHRTSANI